MGSKVFKDNKKAECKNLPANHYKKADHTSGSCGTVPITSTGWGSDQSDVSQKANCKFACATGRQPVGTGENGECSIPDGHIATGNGTPTQCTNGEVANTAQSKCVNPGQGHFSKNGVETPCKGSAPATSTGWVGTQPSTVTSDTTCEFDCASSRSPVGTGSNGKCDIPDGHIATGNGSPTQCTNGKVANTAQSQCVDPTKGHYSKNGVETPCKGNPPASSTGWVGVQPSTVTTEGSCQFTCASGRDASGTGENGSCNLKNGYFATTATNAIDCGTAPGSSQGWDNDQSNVGQKSECKFVCATGRDTNGTGDKGSCSLKNGYFATTANDAIDCGTAPGSSQGWDNDQSSVGQKSECKFVCSKGRQPVGTGANRECSIPDGYIATGNGAPTQCTGGKVSKGAQTQCVSPQSGHFSKDGVETSCGTVHDSVSSWAADQSTVTQVSDCNIACASSGTTVPARAGASTGTTAQCEKQCSPNNAPANSGRIAWATSAGGGSGGWGTNCEVVFCNAGYDDEETRHTCQKTIAEHYAEGDNRRTRQQCTVNGSNKGLPSQYASWSTATGLTLASQCDWICHDGYTKDSDGDKLCA